MKAVLFAALERETSKRKGFVRRLCGGDRALYREVLSVLEADDVETVDSAQEEAGAAHVAPPRMPDRILGYRVMQKLGAGGMGEVYDVENAAGERFALKRLAPHLASSGDYLRRFRREVRAIATLRHPNIVQLIEVGDDAAEPVLIMERLLGRTLREHLRKRDPLDVDSALDIALGIAAGLGYAHSHGILHRDLKPANIFLTDDGRAKVLDFGLAKLVKSSAGGMPFELSGPLTRTGQMLGTPEYMAPEQVHGDPIDGRVDVFAFGCVLYEMLAGRPAFEGTSLLAKIYAVTHDEPPRLREQNADVPVTLDGAVSRCLQKERDRRPASFTELTAELVAAKRG